MSEVSAQPRVGQSILAGKRFGPKSGEWHCRTAFELARAGVQPAEGREGDVMESTAHEATVPVGQAALFDAPETNVPEDLGYRGSVACAAAGITYRQLDYWARTGLVEPSIRTAHGSGSQRLYNFRDILVLKVVKRLLDTGVSLQNIRAAVAHLRSHGMHDLTRITLMSDGSSVFECTSEDEVIDLVRGGQGVFGIGVGSVWREVEGDLAELPGERSDGEVVTPDGVTDELAQRRARRVG